MSAQTSSFGVRFVILTSAIAILFLLAPHRAHAANDLLTGVGIGVVGTLGAQELAKLIASPGFGKAADLMCNPVIPQCPCGHVPGPKGCVLAPGPAHLYNKNRCPPSPLICQDLTSGSLTLGTCLAPNVCRGITTSFGGSSMGLGGGGLSPIVTSLLGGLLQKLLAPQPPTPPPFGGGTGTGVTPPGLPTCSIYSTVVSSTASSTTVNLSWYSTNATTATLSPDIGPVELQGTRQTTITAATNFILMVNGSSGSNSCSTQVFATNSTSLSTSPNLSELLNSLNSPPVSGTLNTNTPTGPTLPIKPFLPQIQNPVTEVFTTPLNVPLTPATQNPFNQANLTPGAYGDIKILGGGATIIGGTRTDTSEVAGFYGTDSYTGEGGGIVQGLCLARPWASNFLSNIIPPSFFDSLCKWRGYNTGEEKQVEIRYVQAPRTEEEKPTATSSAPTVEPKIQIWAVPESVSLGARTSVFWSTQGVTECTVSSPDGSFTHHAIIGKIEGASTVPLTGATTYTISCIGPDGAPISDFVTVKIGS